MRVVESFPRAVREIENVWIPMADGVRLAARIWLPDDAETDPVPAILESIPYRKRDFTRGRDEPIHRYFAGHGYASVRVDVRGTGDSEGALADEYSETELADAEATIAWIAARPWCTGKVGMMGISWGGFNALQVAARRPAALAAILTVCSSDDRYADDAHYMGGCLLNENLTWGSVLMAVAALPPDPEVVGDGWRESWRRRLEVLRLYPAVWMRHARRDDYWRRGSVREEYGAIGCPVYAVGGWADAYSNAVPRLLQGLEVPRKGLVGPWSHAFPHDSVPGPSIGFLQEALRWWDRWLKGIENGIMEEPPLRVWMQEHVPPTPFLLDRPGRWVSESGWPPRSSSAGYHLLTGQRLGVAPEDESPLKIRSPQTTGLAGGEWCAFGSPGEMPGDQRGDDGRSLLFDTPPLEERIEILGAPVVELELAVDRPVALIAARLNDVGAGGDSSRVTYGLLNLTHRASHTEPEPLEPGRRYRIRLALNDVAHVFPVGHRIRLAISSAYWPIAWPPPEPVTLTVFAGASRLELPVRLPGGADDELRPFDPPEAAPRPVRALLHPAEPERTIERDLTTNETVYTLRSDGGDYAGAALTRLEPIDLEVGHTTTKRFSIRPRDPLSARSRVEHRLRLRRRGWDVRVRVVLEMTSTADALHARGEVEALEGDAVFATRSWEESVPRDLV